MVWSMEDAQNGMEDLRNVMEDFFHTTHTNYIYILKLQQITK